MAAVKHNTAGLIQDPAAWLKLDNAARKKKNMPVLTLEEAQAMAAQAKAAQAPADQSQGPAGSTTPAGSANSNDPTVQAINNEMQKMAAASSQWNAFTSSGLDPNAQVTTVSPNKMKMPSHLSTEDQNSILKERAGQSETIDSQLKRFQTMNSVELQDLQQKLFIGGFYANGIDYGDIKFGTPDDDSLAAYAKALAMAARYKVAGGPQTVDDVINDAAAQGKAGGALKQLNLNLTSPAELNVTLDSIANKVLGRGATSDEKRLFVAGFQQMQRSAQLTENQVALGSAAGTGGNNISTAVGAFGDQLAAQYGLTVTSHQRTAEHNKEVGGAPNSDHLTGKAIDLAGDPQKMAQLAAWAKDNTGPDKMLRFSQNEGDHVHLSFNDSAFGNQPSGASAAAAPAAGGDQIDSFMQAIKDVETSGGNYTETNKIGAAGAYQYMPGTWNNYKGYKSAADAPPAIQDEKARADMTALYNKYHDWKLVAIAWQGGVGTADKYLKTGAGSSDGNLTSEEYANRVLSHFNSGGTSGSTLGQAGQTLVTETAAPNAIAEAEQQLREKNPVEARAHDTANVFSSFLNIIGRAGMGSAS